MACAALLHSLKYDSASGGQTMKHFGKSLLFVASVALAGPAFAGGLGQGQGGSGPAEKPLVEPAPPQTQPESQAAPTQEQEDMTKSQDTGAQSQSESAPSQAIEEPLAPPAGDQT